MTIMLRVFGYGWIGLGTLIILVVYYLSTRLPGWGDAIGALALLLPGIAAVIVASVLDRRRLRDYRNVPD
jgi:hypothetical protein